jgi:hypothetical protein
MYYFVQQSTRLNLEVSHSDHSDFFHETLLNLMKYSEEDKKKRLIFHW